MSYGLGVTSPLPFSFAIAMVIGNILECFSVSLEVAWDKKKFCLMSFVESTYDPCCLHLLGI